MPRAFESLQVKNYRYFWFGEGISLIGLWMQTIAQGWLVYDITGSKFLLGLIGTIAGLPVLFLTPIGGIIADHVNKKKLLLFTQVVFALFSFLIGVMISTGVINFWNLAVIVFIMGIANSIDSPTRQSFVIELVGRKHLANAIALNSMAFNTARALGPAVAGYLIGRVGVQACYFINAASFLAVIYGLLLVKGDFSPKFRMQSGMGNALASGFNYAFNNKKIFYSLLLVAFTSLFIMPYAILMPVFAKDILKVGAQGLGTLMAFSGFGALVGAFMLAQFSSKANQKNFIMISTLVTSIAILAFSQSLNLYFSCAMLWLIGWGIVSQAASVNTLIQHEVPDELRGRIMSFYVMSFMGLMPVGAFQAGVGSHFFGAPNSLAFGGIISLIPAFFVIKYFRKNPS